ncbi:alpha/beta fold hydrolase [Chloroflexota bacterium]
MNGKWQHRFVKTNGISMHYVEQGEGFPVLLLHGFPETWFAWQYQIPVLADAGFRVIAPDMRGYGETDKPKEIVAYDIHHLVGDMTGLLDALEIDRAVIIGHDWGGVVMWMMPIMVPEYVERVIGINQFLQPRPDIPPMEVIKKKLGPIRPIEDYEDRPENWEYQLYFQKPGRAEADVEANVGAWVETRMQSRAVNKDMVPTASKVYIEALRKGGIAGPLNYYRNIDRNWHTTSYLKHRRVNKPALMIFAENDPVLKPHLAEGMEKLVTNLTSHLISNCGHYGQQEHPDEVNHMILDFLDDLRNKR